MKVGVVAKKRQGSQTLSRSFQLAPSEPWGSGPHILFGHSRQGSSPLLQLKSGADHRSSDRIEHAQSNTTLEKSDVVRELPESNSAKAYSIKGSYSKPGLVSSRRTHHFGLFSGFQRFEMKDDGKNQDKIDVSSLEDWKVKNITLKQHEFAIQSHTMLSEIINNTKNFRYEKQMEDCTRFDIIFRPKNHTKYVSQIAATAVAKKSTKKQSNSSEGTGSDGEGPHNLEGPQETETKTSLPDVANLTSLHAGQQASEAFGKKFLGQITDMQLKDLREEVLTEVASNKTLRKLLAPSQGLVASKRTGTSNAASRSLLLPHTRKTVDLPIKQQRAGQSAGPDKLALLLESVSSGAGWKMLHDKVKQACNVYLLEDIVGGFKHLAEQYSVSEIHLKAVQSADILLRALEERRDKSQSETVSQNHHEDIRRCEDTHRELLKIQKHFVERVRLFENSILRTKIRIREAEAEIVAVEREKAGEDLVMNRDPTNLVYLSKQRKLATMSPVKAKKMQLGQYKGLIAKALLDYLPDPEVERMVPQAYRNKFRTEDALNELRRGLAQTQDELNLIKTLQDKTSSMLAQSVLAAVKSHQFGNEGFLGLASKVLAFGRHILDPSDGRWFDQNFIELFGNLIKIEAKIYKFKITESKQKNPPKLLKRNESILKLSNQFNPRANSESLIKRFMQPTKCESGPVSRAGTSPTQSGRDSPTRTEAGEHSSKETQLLEELYDQKDQVVRQFVCSAAPLYKDNIEGFERQFRMLLGLYASRFVRLIRLKM